MGLLLAGLSSICFVTLDVLRKVLGNRLSAVDVVIGISLGAAAVFGTILGFSGVGAFDGVFLLLAALESIAFTIASLLYVRAVTLSPLSLTIPYLGFTPVVAALVAFLLLGEIPRPQGLLGISLVVTGAVLLHLGGQEGLAALVTAHVQTTGALLAWLTLVAGTRVETETDVHSIPRLVCMALQLSRHVRPPSFALVLVTLTLLERVPVLNHQLRLGLLPWPLIHKTILVLLTALVLPLLLVLPRLEPPTLRRRVRGLIQLIMLPLLRPHQWREH